jgi:hypothetical protein
MAAATIRSFSARDQLRRLCTDVITSTCALVIGVVLGLSLGRRRGRARQRRRGRGSHQRAASGSVLAKGKTRAYRLWLTAITQLRKAVLANYARPCFSGRRTDGFSATRRGRSFSLLQAPTQERSCKHLQRRCLWQQNAILRLSKPFDKELIGPALLLPDETRIAISPSRPQGLLDCPGFFFVAV